MHNTLPFLLELNANATMNRMTFLSMMDEFDIKGKLSGKGITSKNHEPIDFTGYFIQRLGYGLRKESDFCDFHGYRECTHQVFLFALNSLVSGFSREIDREGSTNKTIKAFAIAALDKSPLDPVIEYNKTWYARGIYGGYRLDFDYSTEATAHTDWNNH